MEGKLWHTCEDGHHWQQHTDEEGGVSPSWGYGLTRIHYPQGDERCPEPERGHSRYTDPETGEPVGPFHGYQCPSCGAVHYAGGCLHGVRCDPWNTPDPECDPPPPACGKPPVATERWDKGDRRRGIPGGWKPITAEARNAETEAGTQLELA